MQPGSGHKSLQVQEKGSEPQSSPLWYDSDGPGAPWDSDAASKTSSQPSRLQGRPPGPSRCRPRDLAAHLVLSSAEVTYGAALHPRGHREPQALPGRNGSPVLRVSPLKMALAAEDAGVWHRDPPRPVPALHQARPTAVAGELSDPERPPRQGESHTARPLEASEKGTPRGESVSVGSPPFCKTTRHIRWGSRRVTSF